jgi:hypothetical protein
VTVSVDMSEINQLIDTLDRASKRPAKERARALDRRANNVAEKARATVATYDKKSTGELGSTIDVTGTDLAKVIGSPVKQGWFLEAGTPTTGAPRPWLSRPAEEELDGLLDDLAKSAEPW